MKYTLNIDNLEKIFAYLKIECQRQFISMRINETIYNYINKNIHKFNPIKFDIPAYYDSIFRYSLIVECDTVIISNEYKEKVYSYDEILDMIFEKEEKEFDNTFEEMQTIVGNHLKKINNMKGENMLKILELYENKKIAKIEYKYDTEIEELRKNDPIQKIIKETNDKITTILRADNEVETIHSNSCRIDYSAYTTRTLNKERELYNEELAAKNELFNKIHEIEALLELAPNYEEKIQILRDYDIIDKKKNIVL